MISREKLESYLVRLELTFQEAGKGTWVRRRRQAPLGQTRFEPRVRPGAD